LEADLASHNERPKTPGFEGSLGGVWTGVRNSQFMVTVGGMISNPHGPDSGLKEWAMNIELPNGIHSEERSRFEALRMKSSF